MTISYKNFKVIYSLKSLIGHEGLTCTYMGQVYEGKDRVHLEKD